MKLTTHKVFSYSRTKKYFMLYSLNNSAGFLDWNSDAVNAFFSVLFSSCHSCEAAFLQCPIHLFYEINKVSDHEI